MSKSYPLLIGILAGLATALLYFSSYMVGMLGKLPLYIAPLPIYLAVFSMGSFTGLIAAITSIAVTLALAPALAVATVGAVIALPALLLGHQANLAQESEGRVAWYPMDNLLFNIAIAIGGGVILIGLITGFDGKAIIPVVVQQMQQIVEINPELKTLREEDLTALAQTFAKLIPFFYPGIWLVTHVINAHLASTILRSSGRMPRPVDDLSMDLNLPVQAVVMLPTAMILMMFGTGALAHISAVIAGVLFMAFAIVGLGALHLKMRGKPTAKPLLIITYLVIFLFSFPLLIFAIAGVARAISRLGFPAKPNSKV